ncbi:unnamed protein product [Paramecium pentaurelia]|uniref:Uncharacterized protein n=1 Tax=Paramecium pentaurelia TaxID=43138 RepID=A0A8S1T8F5_9CILI|nr:unnamed protein product [Paramecium pentaurelia]
MQVKHYRLISELYSPQNKSSSSENIFRVTKISSSQPKLSSLFPSRATLSTGQSFTTNESAMKISAIIPKMHDERPYSRVTTGFQKNRTYLDCKRLTSQTKYMQTLDDWEMNTIEEIQMRRTSNKQTINCKQLCDNNIVNKMHFTSQKKVKKNSMSKVIIINHQGKPKIYYYMQ